MRARRLCTQRADQLQRKTATAALLKASHAARFALRAACPQNLPADTPTESVA